MKTIISSFLLITLLLLSGIDALADKVQVGETIEVGPDGVKIGDNIEINRGGVRVGDVKDETGDSSDQSGGQSDEGRVYRSGDFTGDLSGKSFKGATFHGTDFENANLSNADFTNAKLHGVDFDNVNLEGACFINTSLHGVDFNASNLNGAIFTGSANYNTDYNFTDKSGIIWDGPTVCPGHEETEASQGDDVTSRPEVTKAESIKEALIAGPNSKIDLTVNFPTGSDEIKSQAHVQVLEIANAIKSPELVNQRILIEGHTDNVGDDDYNVDLSYKRAVRVMRVLNEEYGVDTARLQVKGYGESNPVASNNTDQGRALNRRVTIVNIGTM